MQDINLTGPLMDAVIASVTTGTTATLTVADIDATIAQLDQHGGTQSLAVTGNIVAGVFLGNSFSLQLITTTNKSNNMETYTDLSWHLAASRSAETHDIVRLECDDPREELDLIDQCESVSELGYAKIEGGQWDVWGTYLGREFRLRIAPMANN